MRKVNYKSDFDFKLKLKDGSGKEVPWPQCDWDALFWTSSKANAFRASCKGGVCVNCVREADGVRIVFDNHRLGIGTLKWEPHFEIPDALYPDGVRDTYNPAPLEIELVSGQGDEPTDTEVEYTLPYIKGDKGEKGDTGPIGPKGDTGERGPQGLRGEKGDAFTYADFTADQLASLKGPKGDKGDKGEQGVQGPQGVKGDTGERGPQGLQGERGEKGDKGDTGAQGPQGIQGPKGDTGLGFSTEQSAKLNALPTAAELDGEIDAAKRKVFDDLWLAAVGTYGSIDHTHTEDGVSKPYYLNELWLTYQEAVKIMELGKLTNNDNTNRYSSSIVRTMLPANIRTSIAGCQRTFFGSRVEKISLDLGVPYISCFENCKNLDTILIIYAPNTDINPNVNNTNVYKNCIALKSIKKITRTFAYDFSLADSPLIDRATLDLIVQKKWDSDAAKSMTITVHPNVYAKLTGDTTNEVAAALTADELAQWQAVLTAAAARKISFATV